MRVFVYRHWDMELALVGDWPGGAALDQITTLHERLWSDSPPRPRPEADPEERATLTRLRHPLADALVLLYHCAERALDIEQESAESAHALRAVALRVLQAPAIALLAATEAPLLLERDALQTEDGARVRWLALSTLRELAQPADLPLLTARLEVPARSGPIPAELHEERAEAVHVLTALLQRAPALAAQAGLAERLLVLAQGDASAEVRVAAVQALMAGNPSQEVLTALRAIAAPASGTAGEPEWAAAIALFEHEPAAHVELVLDVHERSERPEGSSVLYGRLDLLAQEATLRRCLHRPGGAAPLLWHESYGAVFALCLANGSAPPGAEDPGLQELVAQWRTAAEGERAALLQQLASCGHVAGRALALLARMAPEAEYDAYADQEEEEPLAEDVDWPAVARAVLADPAVNRLSAADVRARGTDAVDCGGERSCNHLAAIKALASLEKPAAGDAQAMARCFLQTGSDPREEAVRTAVLIALYGHSQRSGQAPPAPEFLSAVVALARHGVEEPRRRAVQLLGRWPAARTAELLRELTQDATHTVCCLAERALAEQARLVLVRSDFGSADPKLP